MNRDFIVQLSQRWLAVHVHSQETVLVIRKNPQGLVFFCFFLSVTEVIDTRSFDTKPITLRVTSFQRQVCGKNNHYEQEF